MRRGGDYAWPPGYTQYPWVGLEGFVACAVILHRQGYPAFANADQAVRRAMDYQYFLKDETGNNSWADGVRADASIHLVNVAYGESFFIANPAVGKNRLYGWTDWTHPTDIGEPLGGSTDTTPPAAPQGLKISSP